MPTGFKRGAVVGARTGQVLQVQGVVEGGKDFLHRPVVNVEHDAAQFLFGNGQNALRGDELSPVNGRVAGARKVFDAAGGGFDETLLGAAPARPARGPHSQQGSGICGRRQRQGKNTGRAGFQQRGPAFGGRRARLGQNVGRFGGPVCQNQNRRRRPGFIKQALKYRFVGVVQRLRHGLCAATGGG